MDATADYISIQARRIAAATRGDAATQTDDTAETNGTPRRVRKQIRRKVVARTGTTDRLECGHELPVPAQNNTPSARTRRCRTCERLAAKPEGVKS